ncbi:class I SAM-dependent methyltransferase [Rhizobium sp. AB2/73]|uniref:class I SAM-dependent methyltransferase n=1 Tax=Rhizobium sp. AB2/73 TaxID=2795216 RepID=UPI001C5D076C|nr:class I SAM-dependent methyltransferase [Rhizobium sp. AB2/73]QYA13701.1 class I SAM-dependent methyltransferase [Rhizobium sp. AB2/73]UEQ80369.1 class I SAM-dependent methyltransferase [Rhizobium sp. AB2/73]
MSSGSFYRAFEEKFRGDRAEITKRLEVYLPFVKPLLDDGGTRSIIDLGCGRGEWLELMQSIGMVPHGVDLDDGMLEDCFARNLSAEKLDAIACLKSLPDESQAIVSGFHIAEHLHFEVLQTLISEALRVLRPGGLLILETPNAENVSVGTLTFHMDPTHNRPLPPGLLSFLPRFYGYARAVVIRLQENGALRHSGDVRLIDVFQGVSPDYAVVAQKAAPNKFLQKFDGPFNADYGLTLDTLSQRFEARLISTAEFEVRSRATNEAIAEASAFLSGLKSEFDRVRLDLAQTQQEFDLLRQEFDLLRQERDVLREVIDNYQQRLMAVYKSSSWRITAPFRKTMGAIRRLRHGHNTVILDTKIFIANVLRRLIRFAVARPTLRRVAVRFLSWSPRTTDWLKRLIVPGPVEQSGHFHHRIDHADLSPHAKRIFEKFKSATER